MRLDSTDEEAELYWAKYHACLKEHGTPENHGSAPGPRSDDPNVFPLDVEHAPQSALAACKRYLPLQPPELDADRNPNLDAQWAEAIQCMRKAGLRIHSTGVATEYTYDDDAPPLDPELEEKVSKRCINEVFGNKKK